AERQPVAEAGVHRVLEVRVRVHESGQDRGAVEVAFGSALADLCDLSAVEGDECVAKRRAVDRNHPVGGDRPGHVWTAVDLDNRRLARRSSRAQSWIDPSKRMNSGTSESVVVTGST